MDEKKAIKWVEARLASGPSIDEAYEAGLLAIAAIKKRIPQKPYSSKEGEEINYYCRQCKSYLTDSMIKHLTCIVPDYCPKCGQAIDWSGEND